MKPLTDYTREELQALPAGDAMDRLVWDVIHPDLPTVTMLDGEFVHIFGKLPYLPSCSFSSEHAMMALNAYSRQGTALGIWTNYSPGAEPVCTGFTIKLWQGAQWVFASEEKTLPLAICRAIVLHAWDLHQQRAPQTEPHDNNGFTTDPTPYLARPLCALFARDGAKHGDGKAYCQYFDEYLQHAQASTATEPSHRADLDALQAAQRQHLGLEQTILNCKIQRLESLIKLHQLKRDGIELQIQALAKGGSDAR